MLGVFVDGVIVALIAFAPTVALAILAFFALGIANAILNSANSARLQLVPVELRGRVFASNATLINLTSPVSLAAAGALAAPLGPVTIVLVSGLGLMGVGALGFLASLRQREGFATATAA
jgi:hypothetical protein